jgi:hypothetical protein
MHAVEDGIPSDKKTPGWTIVLQEELIHPALFFRSLAAPGQVRGISGDPQSRHAPTDVERQAKPGIRSEVESVRPDQVAEQLGDFRGRHRAPVCLRQEVTASGP